MLRAAMRELLVRKPDDPFAFLAVWFWEHSAANQYETSGAPLTQRDVDVRRRAVAETRDDLALVNRSLSRLLSDDEQVAAAAAMLDRLAAAAASAARASAAWRVRCFNDLGDLERATPSATRRPRGRSSTTSRTSPSATRSCSTARRRCCATSRGR